MTPRGGLPATSRCLLNVQCRRTSKVIEECDSALPYRGGRTDASPPPGRVTPQNDTLTPASPHCGSTVTGTGPEPFSCFERQQPRRQAGRHDTSDCRPSPGPPLRLPLLSRAGQVSTPRRPRFLCCLSCSLRKTHFEAPGACSPERDGPRARGVWEWRWVRVGGGGPSTRHPFAPERVLHWEQSPRLRWLESWEPSFVQTGFEF